MYIFNIILQKCGWRENITLTLFEPHLALSLMEKDNFKQKLRRIKSDFMYNIFFFFLLSVCYTDFEVTVRAAICKLVH